MANILIVDGSNLLFQMFYGMPARIVGKNGRPIQGTLGFVGALLKMIRRVEPDHVAVVFDGECSNERTQLDPDYKANREDFSAVPEEETPFSQLPDIFAALNTLGIPYKETVDCEADDWIAGLAKAYGEEHLMTIVSQDSDFFQLITPNVRILRYRGEQSVICDEAWLQEKYGILPQQYASFKALNGDSADNIRGVDKVGPKTAAALLRQFGDLKTMLDATCQISKPSVRNSVERSRERILKNHALIHLEGKCNLPFALEEICWRDAGMTTTQVLKNIGLR